MNELNDLERRAAFLAFLSQAQKVMSLNNVEFSAQLMEVAMDLAPELFTVNEDEEPTGVFQ
ncbi:hypothetical protein [Xanthobacter sp. ZOL 2024]